MTERYYSARIARAGALIGVRVWFGPPLIAGEELDRSPRWQVQVGDEDSGRAVDQFADDGRPVDVHGITLRIHEAIDEADYRYMVARQNWAVDHAPNDPQAAPRKAVDLRATPGLF